MELWAETLSILEKDERWDVKKHPFDEMGCHLDNEGSETQRRIYKNAAQRYACETNVAEGHAENRGDDPHDVPVDHDRNDDFHGQCFCYNPDNHDQIPDHTTSVPTATCSVNRIERGSTRLSQKKCEAAKPVFLNASKEVVENAINATTQYAENLLSGPTIKNAHRSRNPACNVH